MKHRWRWVWLALAGAVLLAGLLTVDTAPVEAQEGSQEPAQEQDLRFDNGYCLGCHDGETSGISLANPELPSGEVLDINVHRDTYQFSVHGRLDISCVLCHTNISEYPHQPIEAQNLREYAVANYAACATCHEAQYTATHDNVHGTALLNGNNEAPVCTDCHGAHNVQPAEVRGTAIQQTCENCHFEIYSVYEGSVHGAALFEEGNVDVPTCTDCHGVHDVAGPSETGFHLFSPQICADCHEDEDLMEKYGISTEVFDTYVADFHGSTVVIFEKTAPDQETNKAVCIDCHGVHNMASADDPESPTFRENLLGTCQRCHPDATANFPTSWMSHYSPTREQTPLVFWVNLFYRILIPVTIGAMLVWVLLDLVKRVAARVGGGSAMLDEQERVEQVRDKYLRFTVSDRVEHWMQVITFVVLALTGLIQKWPQAGFSEIAIKAMGGIEAVRIIHRIFATILLLAVVYHVYTVGVKVFVKRSRRTMVPGPGDLKAAFQGLLYNLGFRKEHPPQGHFTWEEKIEYWAIVWGTLVMTVTGFMLWNPIATAKYLPGQFIPAAKAAHGGEALLAVLAILVWHFYHVHIRSFNTTIFTGYISREEMQKEHALELAEIESSGLPPPVDPATLKKRMRLFLPIYAGVAAVLLAGIYLFVTIEETAIATIEPAEDVQVFVPSPNATVPLVTTTQAAETTTTTPSGTAASWETGVEQLFVGSCGACHGAGALGGLNVTTYALTVEGGNSGPGIVAGDPDASVVYTRQLQGGHPGQFSDTELATILEWIETGAPETAGTAGGGTGNATWNGVWATVMADSCGACHGAGALGGLNVTTYALTVEGGNSGPGIVAGDPDASILYTRQLQGGHPGQLRDAQLAELAAWIEAGAPEK